MEVFLAHKIALDPTQDQKRYFAQACGVSRFAWNWGLARWKQEYALWKEYQCGPKPFALSLARELNAIKAEQYPWMCDVTKNAVQSSIQNLGNAYKRFFKGVSKPPTFKKKGKKDSFRTDNGTSKNVPQAVQVDGKKVKLPIIGWVKMHEKLRFSGQIKSAVVSRIADKWFISLMVKMDRPVPTRKNQTVGGVDLGIKALATCSDGSVYVGPMALRSNLKALRRANKTLHRKKKASRNRKKAAMRVAKIHAGIANIRKDALHKASASIIGKFDILGIEDLHVKGMLKNDRLSRAISDVGMGEFRRQLEYKALLNGVQIVVADRFFPSSKRCSDCGWIYHDLTLDKRDWTCYSCGVVHERDINAARNLAQIAVSSTVTACGEMSAGFARKSKTKLASKKQESLVIIYK